MINENLKMLVGNIYSLNALKADLREAIGGNFRAEVGIDSLLVKVANKSWLFEIGRYGDSIEILELF